MIKKKGRGYLENCSSRENNPTGTRFDNNGPPRFDFLLSVVARPP